MKGFLLYDIQISDFSDGFSKNFLSYKHDVPTIMNSTTTTTITTAKSVEPFSRPRTRAVTDFIYVTYLVRITVSDVPFRLKSSKPKTIVSSVGKSAYRELQRRKRRHPPPVAFCGIKTAYRIGGSRRSRRENRRSCRTRRRQLSQPGDMYYRLDRFPRCTGSDEAVNTTRNNNSRTTT